MGAKICLSDQANHKNESLKFRSLADEKANEATLRSEIVDWLLAVFALVLDFRQLGYCINFCR